MLDRACLFEAIQKVQNKLFLNSPDEIIMARGAWQQLQCDPMIAEHVQENEKLPTWSQSLAYTKKIISLDNDYQVLAIDGSQIYPDRHEGTAASLINVGGVWFHYQTESVCEFFSEPSVYCASYRENHEISTDSIDAHRHELELKKALMKSIEYKDRNGLFPIVLFDGSLIFWHLVDKPHIKKYYLERYCALLNRFHEQGILNAGYISLPKSRELINLVLFSLKQQNKADAFLSLVDTDLLVNLKLYERTTIFHHRSALVAEYPMPLRPSFFYINVGEEIARVEIPRWIAESEQFVQQIEELVVDQCKKGDGYPIALAEAHAQAVVKSSDRQFFYYVINHFGQNQNKSIRISRKYLKKKSMHV